MVGELKKRYSFIMKSGKHTRKDISLYYDNTSTRLIWYAGFITSIVY